MEVWKALDQSAVASTIEQWRASLVQALLGHVDTFDVISGSGDDPTIVSFRCRRRGRVLGVDELHAVYRRITSTRRPLPGYERAFIGQPVESGGVAMLRLALGANDLRKLQDGSETMDDDHRLVELIAATIGC
jgi:hypothetical protein